MKLNNIDIVFISIQYVDVNIYINSLHLFAVHWLTGKFQA